MLEVDDARRDGLRGQSDVEGRVSNGFKGYCHDRFLAGSKLLALAHLVRHLGQDVLYGGAWN